MDFGAILKDTLAGINAGFEQAAGDLQEVLDAITEGIQEHTNSGYKVYAKVVSEDTKATIFRLYFDPDPLVSDAEVIPLTTLQVSAKGYPIMRGTYRKVGGFTPAASDPVAFQNRAELEQYFAHQLSDPDSNLVQAIGFAMRKMPN